MLSGSNGCAVTDFRFRELHDSIPVCGGAAGSDVDYQRETAFSPLIIMYSEIRAAQSQGGCFEIRILLFR